MIKPILCLMGPTASGKTQFALQLAECFPCDIISVDSVMVYRGLDIGTDKPDTNILSRVPHHLIDIRDPEDIFSVGDFIKEARHAINSIMQKGRIPLLVGGTMLYFHALQQGLAHLPIADQKLRSHLKEEMDKSGISHLHDYLMKIDPLTAKRIHPQDKQRIQRAIEVFHLTGTSITLLQQDNINYFSPSDFHFFALAPSHRKHLHEKIAARFSLMLAKGFIDEVKKLFDRGDLSLKFPAIRAVGYKQAWEYLAGILSYEMMQEKAIIATRQLAKRQMTWLRSFKTITWLTENNETNLAIMRKFFEQFVN